MRKGYYFFNLVAIVCLFLGVKPACSPSIVGVNAESPNPISSLLAKVSSESPIQGEIKQDKSNTFIVVPVDSVPLLTAYQPDCPIEIIHAELHAYLSGGSYPDLKVKNKSRKSIKYYKIAYFDSKGTDGSWISDNKVIMPDEEVVVSAEDSLSKPIPLTAELRKKLGLDNDALGFITFAVIQVEYSDGTKYDYTKVASSLLDSGEN